MTEKIEKGLTGAVFPFLIMVSLKKTDH